jgi:nucleoid-associated protein YgaU
MGRLEKIVVVVVLFLVAVILGISLGTDGEGSSPIVRGGNRAQAPEDRADAGTDSPGGLMNAAGPAATTTESSATPPRPAGTAPAPAAAKGPNANAPTTNAPTTNTAGATNVTPNGAAAIEPQPGAPVNPAPNAPAASLVQTPTQKIEAQFLVSREGLEPTATDDLMLYTWKAGDTFKALSQKYYGSNLHVSRLRNANEGRKEELLAAGEKILVPVAPAAAADRIARSAPKEAAASATWTGGLYTVSTGDVLGLISQKVYGTSKKWKKIYDANRDVIGENPNALKVGAQLRIPE